MTASIEALLCQPVFPVLGGGTAGRTGKIGQKVEVRSKGSCWSRSKWNWDGGWSRRKKPHRLR